MGVGVKARRGSIVVTALVGCLYRADSVDGGEPAGLGTGGGDASATDASGDGALTAADDADGGPEQTGTGPGEGCGNEVVDPGEDCDDGNRLNADGCNNDCRPSGQLLWDYTLGGGAALVEEAMGVAAETDGTFVVGGYTSDAAGLSDGWVRRFSAMGADLWTQTHAGPGAGNDQIRGVASDRAGAVYVAGYEAGPAGEGANAWLRKQDLDGNEVWSSTYNGPNSSTDVLLVAALDGEGNVVTGGYHGVPDNNADVFLRKYTPGGDVLWTRTYAGPAAGTDLVWDVEASPAGNLYVAGYETGVADEGANAWLGKYDTDGNLLWSRSYNGGASLGDFFVGIEVVDDDDVIVCGYEEADAYPWQTLVRRYDATGMILWTDTYSGASAEGAHGFGMKADGDGNLVTVGGEIVDGTRGILVRKYDPAGAVLWSRVFPGGAAGPDYGRDVAIGTGDLIYAVGAMNTGVDDRDIWVGVLTP